MNYYFERHQYLKFEVLDGLNSGSDEVIGSIETTLGAIIGSKNQTFTGELRKIGHEKSRGRIILKVDSV